MEKQLRVLYVVPETMDLGGIAPSSEHIVAGLREAGYRADFMYIRQTKNNVDSGVPARTIYEGQWIEGEGSRLPFHPVLGWGGLGYSLYGEQNIAAVVAGMNTYDVVIWGAAFGFNVDAYRARTDWFDVFKKVKAKKVVMLRDDHLWDAQGWYAMLDKYVDGWACVHQCSFDMAAEMTKPRAIIPSPHKITDVPKKFTPLRARVPATVFSVQNAKSWKKVDQLVRAVPYAEAKIILAGDGLVIRNMRAPASGGKLKACYVGNERLDPDIPKKNVGKRIWDIASGSKNFSYLGPVNEAFRDEIYGEVSYGIDLSNRTNSGQFNRVFIEAAKQGCVMMAVERFMSGGDGSNWLKPYVHYLPVDPEYSPCQLATVIDRHIAEMSDNPGRYSTMQNINRALLSKFDRRDAARALVNLALGKRAGWEYGKGDPSRSRGARYKTGRAEFTKLFGEV